MQYCAAQLQIIPTFLAGESSQPILQLTFLTTGIITILTERGKTLQTILFFAAILLTCLVNGFLAWYAWRQRAVPGSSTYAGLALCEFLMTIAEILSMLSPAQKQALFWFQLRYTFIAVIPVFWLIFVLEYSGRKKWLSGYLFTALLIIPVITQALHLSNGLHRLWLLHDVSFHKSGVFWISDPGARVSAIGFIIHSFYSLILLLIGAVLLLITAWRIRRNFSGQALLLAGSGFIAFLFAINSVFHFIPQGGFNFFTPGIGLSVFMIALAVFRFQFLKRILEPGPGSGGDNPGIQNKRLLAIFLLIFITLAAGIVTGGYLSYQGYFRKSRSQVENQLASITAFKVRELINWRKERFADAEFLYKNPFLSALVQRILVNAADFKIRAELLAWLDNYRLYRQYNRIFLLDKKGSGHISSPAIPEPVPAHLANDIESVIRTKEIAFLDFHRDAADSPVHLSLLVPILEKQDNALLGILVLRVDPEDYLYPVIQQWPVPSTSAETLLVKQDGAYVLFLNELRFMKNTALNLRFPLVQTDLPAAKAVLGQEGIVEGIDYRGVPVLAYIHAVPDSPWYLVTRMDKTEVNAPLQERLWGTVVFLVVLMAASGTALGMIWRQQRIRFYRAHRQIEKKLIDSEMQYRSLTENSPDLIARFDYQCRHLYVNPTAAKAGPYSQEEYTGKTMNEVGVPVQEARKWEERIRTVFASGKVIDVEDSFETPDGPRFYNTKFVPEFAADGSIRSVQSIARDITLRKQAEDRVKSLLAEKELILKEVHHRIKNNMNTIYSLLSLQARTTNEPAIVTALKDAGSRVQCMMVLYDKLYQDVVFKDVSLKDYLLALINQIIKNFPNSGSVKIEPYIDEFKLDAKKASTIGIIINELLTNIMKYAFTGITAGLIIISSSIKDNIVSLVIRDNGNGIPESVDFEKSTGFGLKLVGMLTKQLDGTIRIERNNGTKIILEFTK